jgi:TPR repeat protein
MKNVDKSTRYKQRALSWLFEQANVGNMFAKYFLGEIHCHLDVDYSKAFVFYSSACKDGCVYAFAPLGYCYYWGLGITSDHGLAVKWYMHSAEKGNFEGQYLLGMCTQFGYGIDANEKVAFMLYKKSADQGFKSGLLSLADCCEQAMGTQQDLAAAVRLRCQATSTDNRIT